MQVSDLEFLHQMNECVISPTDFTHEAHLRLAWVQINVYGIEAALQNVPAVLKKYVNFVGASDKYHETLTLAATKAVYHFMLKSNSKKFDDFLLEFPALKYNFKGLMVSHYGMTLLTSNEAKVAYVEPDLLPFDI